MKKSVSSKSYDAQAVAFRQMRGNMGGHPLVRKDTFANPFTLNDEVNHWTPEKMYEGLDFEYEGNVGGYAIPA